MTMITPRRAAKPTLVFAPDHFQPKAHVPVELLRELIEYDPATGGMIWKPRPASMFTVDWQCRAWNNRNAGTQCGHLSVHGYLIIGLKSFRVRAHRVAWAIHYGEWPLMQVDHRNGDKLDNRIENLRLTTHSQNQRNMRMRKSSKSGCLGVSFIRGKRVNPWRATIGGGSRDRSLWIGYFPTKDAAIEARKAAEMALGYDRNHGSIPAERMTLGATAPETAEAA